MSNREARTRDTTGKHEVEDIRNIVHNIHTRNQYGLQIIHAYKQKFGVDILDARMPIRRGNRKTHYDFEIMVAPNVWKTVEAKIKKDFVPILDHQTPWAAGVQMYNGGCEKFPITLLYAKSWYELYIASGMLKREYGLRAEIPSFDDWFKLDLKQQGDPKTAFGKELKKTTRETGKDLLALRTAVIAQFNPSEEDIAQFKQQVLTIVNDALNQKDYWLTIHGNVEGEFHCAWYPKFTLSGIESIAIRKEKDIWFDFQCAETSFTCILRWGKGCGFSNLRIDAR